MLAVRAQLGEVAAAPARPRRARVGGRRLRARAGRAGAALPRHPPGRAGAATCATPWPPRPRRARGTPPRSTAARPTAPPGPASQIDGAVSGRFARDVTARQATVDGAPGVEVTVRANVPALGLGGPGGRARASPGTRSRSSRRDARAPRRGRQRPGRADLARRPAAGADAVDRAVGLRGAARRVRASAARPARPAAPTPSPRTTPRGGPRAEAAARQALADQGWPTRRSRCGSPARRTRATATAARR